MLFIHFADYNIFCVIELPADAKFGVPIGEDGRWGSYHKGLKWMKENMADMRLQCIDDEHNKSLTVEVRNIILNEQDYWNDLDFTINVTTVLDATLTKYEADNMNPGEVLYRWSRLYSQYEDMERFGDITRQELRYLTRMLDDKWSLMDSKLHKAVYLIDPRFRDEPLELSDVVEGESYLKEKAGDKWDDEYKSFYESYHLKRSPFDTTSFNLDLKDDPRDSYKLLTRARGYKEYALFCIDLLNVNGTSVKLERSFKTVRIVHSQLRRSLKPDVLRMLVMDNHNLLALEKYEANPLI